MKLKFLLSLFVLITFSIIGGASFEDIDITTVILVIVLPILTVGLSIYIGDKRSAKKYAEFDRQYQQEEQKKEEIFKEWYNSYVATNGKPSQEIILEKNRKSKVIYVHENEKKIYILNNMYRFSEILSCSCSDNQTIIKGKVNAITKSKNGSTLGGAIVGGVIAGPAGAIIGGATSKKTTEYHQEADRIKHDYRVIINVDSVSRPMITIDLGFNENLANEIVCLLNVIIARK
jgi:hypothetical protein